MNRSEEVHVLMVLYPHRAAKGLLPLIAPRLLLSDEFIPKPWDCKAVC